MTDYLRHIIARTLGAATTARPRMPQLFEQPFQSARIPFGPVSPDPFERDVDTRTSTDTRAAPLDDSSRTLSTLSVSPRDTERMHQPQPTTSFDGDAARRGSKLHPPTFQREADAAPDPAPPTDASPPVTLIRPSTDTRANDSQQAGLTKKTTPNRQRAPTSIADSIDAPAQLSHVAAPPLMPHASDATPLTTPATTRPTTASTTRSTTTSTIPLPNMLSSVVPREFPSTAPPPVPTVVRIHIGRIEVRAVAPPPSSAPPTPTRTAAPPRLSLDDYLRAQRRHTGPKGGAAG